MPYYAVPVHKPSGFFSAVSPFIFRNPEDQSLPKHILSLSQKQFVTFALPNTNAPNGSAQELIRNCFLLNPST